MLSFTMRTPPAAMIVALIALLMSANASIATMPAGHAAAARRTHVNSRRFVGAGCAAHMPIPPIAYELGRSFDGLVARHHDYVCNPAVNPHLVVSGPSIAVGYVSTTYGTCDASQAGCAPPLDIQNWPECARNPNSYKPNPGVRLEPEEEQLSNELNPVERIRMSRAPWIPALSFEAGTRIELFGGRTTVVVFANAPKLARDAAEALAGAIAREYPRTRSRTLRADANQPGNGRACHVFRDHL
jgi:hypothetical protein